MSDDTRICAECGREGATSTGICLDCTVGIREGKPRNQEPPESFSSGGG